MWTDELLAEVELAVAARTTELVTNLMHCRLVRNKCCSYHRKMWKMTASRHLFPCGWCIKCLYPEGRPTEGASDVRSDEEPASGRVSEAGGVR